MYENSSPGTETRTSARVLIAICGTWIAMLTDRGGELSMRLCTAADTKNATEVRTMPAAGVAARGGREVVFECGG